MRTHPPSPPPPERASDNWYFAKYADMYDMYSLKFTLCYRLIKSLLRIRL